VTYGIGAVLLIAALLGGAFLLRSRNGQDEEKAWTQAAPGGMPAMPSMSAQPAVAMPDFSAQPAVQQPVAAVQQPVAAVQPAPVADPAREYYNSLLTQGYPAADALGYTQQYYPGFQG
jgi:hypothetical protein